MATGSGDFATADRTALSNSTRPSAERRLWEGEVAPRLLAVLVVFLAAEPRLLVFLGLLMRKR